MTDIEKEEFIKIIDYMVEEQINLEIKCDEYKKILDIISDLMNIESKSDLYTYEQNNRQNIFHNEILCKLYYLVLKDLVSKESKNELYYQERFKNSIGKLIPNGKIIQRKRIGGNIPDAWVEVNGEQIPVEVKKYNFNNKALMQLQRYMTVYNTKRGIAVANTLSIDLPENIVFIPFSKFD